MELEWSSGFFSGGCIDDTSGNVRDIESSVALASNEKFLSGELSEYSVFIDNYIRKAWRRRD